MTTSAVRQKHRSKHSTSWKMNIPVLGTSTCGHSLISGSVFMSAEMSPIQTFTNIISNHTVAIENTLSDSQGFIYDFISGGVSKYQGVLPSPFRSPFPFFPFLPSIPPPYSLSSQPLHFPSLPPFRSRTPQIQLGGLGSDVSSPSGVWGGAPAKIKFGAF